MRRFTIIICSCLCMLASLAAAPSASAQDAGEDSAPDSLMVAKFFNFMYESRFDGQDVIFRRCAPGETMTLGEVFDTLGLQVPDRAVVCSKGEDGGTSVSALGGEAAFRGFDIFDSLNTSDKDGKTVPRTGENVVVSMEFGPDAPYTSGLVFIRNTAGVNPKDFVRLSMILCPRVGEDDLRSFSASDSAPSTGSWLLSFETGDASSYMEEFNETMASMLRKNKAGEELNDLEYACILGAVDFTPVPEALSAAEDGIGEGRYFDAAASLAKAMEAGKYYWKGEEEDKSQYADICADLAKCWSSLGDTELACRYYEVAYLLDQSYAMEYVLSLAALGDIRARGTDDEETEKEYRKAIEREKASLGEYSPDLTMRDVVCRGLGIPGCGIHSMTAFDMAGKVLRHEETTDGALGCRLSPLLADGNTLVFDYDLDSALTRADKSIMLWDNSVVVKVKKVDGAESLFRLNIMVPNFIEDDTRRTVFDSNNRPASLSFVVSGADDTFPSDPDGIFSHAIEIQDQGLYLQSLKALDYVLKSQKASDYGAGEADISHLMDIYYEIGFCLSELNLLDRALYYQEVSSQSGVTDYVTDYINSLVNNHDPLALSNIEHFSTVEMTEGNLSMKEFQDFLKRRKAYALVNLQMYDEAKALLEEMKGDPDLAQFAKSELEYLESLRSE